MPTGCSPCVGTYPITVTHITLAATNYSRLLVAGVSSIGTVNGAVTLTVNPTRIIAIVFDTAVATT